MNINVNVGPAPEPGTTVDTIKAWLESGQAAATIVALLAAGIWTYLLFVRQRQRYPRAETSHRVSSAQLTESHVLVHVTVGVKNIGDVLVSITSGHTQVQRVTPVDDDMVQSLNSLGDLITKGCEGDWPVLGRRDCDWQTEAREIEPGETDQFHFDFAVPTAVKTIEVYSYLKNKAKPKRDIGWNHTTILQLESCRIDLKKGESDGEG